MEDIKIIVETLNKPPFSKNFNLITYDNLRGDQRIRILFEIFLAIDDSVNIGILEVADVEEVIAKILEMLRILKYSPPRSIEPTIFRQALVTGDRNIMNHIFYYLLTHLTELKQRAYLAKFLVKIEVSPDVEGDQDIVQLYEQYDRLIENFKVIHSSYDSLKQNLDSVQVLQKDVKAMEEEKIQIQEKLANVKRKLDENHDSDLLNLIRQLKETEEKNQNLARQISLLDNELDSLNKRSDKTDSQMRELQSMFQFGVNDPGEILERMHDEMEAKRQLVEEVLPTELSSIERFVQDVEEIESQPSMMPDFLQEVKSKIQKITKEVNVMIEKKMLQADNEDEKLTLVRQSASLVSEKRIKLQEKVDEAMEQLEDRKRKLEERKAVFNCDEILRGDELKKYLDDMRNKSSQYKRKRQELAELRTESAILTRTETILNQKWNRLEKVLIRLEEQRGIVGYFSNQANSEASIRQDEESENSESLRAIISDLNEKISKKKVELAPLVKDLRPLRQQVHELQIEHDQKKSKYDSSAADLESDLSKVEKIVKKLREESDSLASTCFTAKMELDVAKAYADLIDAEMKYFVSDDPDDREKSLQTKLEREITIEMDKKDQLRSRLKELMNNEQTDKRQLSLWKDLRELMKIKQQIIERRKMYSTASSSQQSKKDHLIL